MPFKVVLPVRAAMLRSLKGCSQERIALEVGVGLTTIKAIESGQIKDLKLNTLLKLCAYFGVSPNYLLGYDDKNELVNQYLPPAKLLEAHCGELPALPERNCRLCGMHLQMYEPHLLRDCVVLMQSRGHTLHYIATVLTLSVDDVEAIVTHYWRDLSHRRKRAG